LLDNYFEKQGERLISFVMNYNKGIEISKKVDAILLAAGSSHRMPGVNKLLENFNGQPIVRLVAETVSLSLVQNLIIVTGYEAYKVRRALAGLSGNFIYNSLYKYGLSTSLSAGIRAVAPNSAGALVVLADMPRISVEIINTLIREFHKNKNKLIQRPVFDGRSGNPVLWPRSCFLELSTLTGDQGGRVLFEKFANLISFVQVDESSIHQDIDTFEDLKKLRLF